MQDFERNVSCIESVLRLLELTLTTFDDENLKERLVKSYRKENNLKISNGSFETRQEQSPSSRCIVSRYNLRMNDRISEILIVLYFTSLFPY